MPPTTRSSGGLRLAPQWDEDSDLTDIEDSDSDEEIEQPVKAPLPPQQPRPQSDPQQGPARRSARKSTQQATEERTSPVNKDEAPLPPYYSSNPSVDQISKLIDADLILLEPDYQRGVVWPASKQMALIDSIYRNYPVPNLVFVREFVNEEHSRVCIDGKQRLTSIKRFINGEIAHRDPITKKLKWFKKTAPNQRRVLVSEDWKRKFLAKQLTFYDYENITASQERMIFQRVQLGTVLTLAERLQAANGGCADFLRELRNCVCSTQVFANFGEWGESKGKNFLALSQIVYLVETKKLPSSLPDAEKLSSWLEGSLKNTVEIKGSILLAFNIFGRLSLHERYGPWLSTQGVTPVEFVMAIYAIVVFMHDITDCKLADGIRKMWEADRNSASKGKSAKAIKESYARMRDFVDKMAKVKKIELEYDPTELVNSADMPLLSEEQTDALLHASEGRSTKTSKKRSRSVASKGSRFTYQESSDDDEAPLSRSKKKGSTSKSPAAKKARLSKNAKQNDRIESEGEDDDDDADVIPKRRRLARSQGAKMKPLNVPAKGSTAPKPPSSALRVRRPKSDTPAPTPPPPSAPIPSTSSSKIPTIKIPAPLKPPADSGAGGMQPGCSNNPAPSVSSTSLFPPDFGNGGASSVSGTTAVPATTAAAVPTVLPSWPSVSSATLFNTDPPLSSPSPSSIIVHEPVNNSTAGLPPITVEPPQTEGKSTAGMSAGERLNRLKGRVVERDSQRAATPMQTSPTIPAEVPSSLSQEQKYPTPPGDVCVGDGQPLHEKRTPGSAPGGNTVRAPVQHLAKNQDPPVPTTKNQNAAQSMKSETPAPTSKKSQSSAQTPLSRPRATASSSSQQVQPTNRQQQPQQQRQPSATSTEPPGPDEVIESLRSKKGSYDHMKFSKRTAPPLPQRPVATGTVSDPHHTGTQPHSRTSESEPPFTFDGWVESISVQATKLQEQSRHQQQAVPFSSSSNVAPDGQGYQLKRRRSAYEVDNLQSGAKRVNTDPSFGGGAATIGNFGNTQGGLGLETPPPSAGPGGPRRTTAAQAHATVDPRLQHRGTGGAPPPPR
ncbi:hypothetical protein MD484_g8134, partial [Candolleomyces efflorescens]